MKQRQLYIFLFGLSFIHLLLWNIFLVVSSDFVKTQYIPDDGFYYLTLAKNFIKYSIWTFDSGITRTSGFHLLYAYFLVGILKIGSSQNIITIALASSLAFVLALYYFIWVIYKKYNYENILLISSVMFTSINVFYNTIAIVEWSSVVLLSFVYITISLRIISTNVKYSNLFYLLISLLGTLARIEFIIISLILFLLQYLITFKSFSTENNKQIQNLFYGVVGSLVGLSIVFLHNYYFTNEFLQSSSSIKLFWSSKEGHNPMPFIYQCFRLFISVPRLRVDWPIRQEVFKVLMYFIICSFLVILFYLARAKYRHRIFSSDNREILLVASNILIVSAYIVLYTFNARGIQTWYTGLVFTSLGILAFLLLQQVSKKFEHVTHIAVVIIVANVLVCWISKPFYPNQQEGIMKGKYALEVLSDKNVAAWDSGILGYYSEGHVINLDGLVNNEVVPYIEGDSLIEYLSKKNIYCLIQSPYNKGDLNGFSNIEINDWFIKEEVVYNKQKFNVYRFKKRLSD